MKGRIVDRVLGPPGSITRSDTVSFAFVLTIIAAMVIGLGPADRQTASQQR
jgi:hypothetical protein